MAEGWQPTEASVWIYSTTISHRATIVPFRCQISNSSVKPAVPYYLIWNPTISSFIMNPEVITPFLAIRFFEKNEKNNDELQSRERKRFQVSSVATTSTNKAKLHLIPEDAELQIATVSSSCKEDNDGDLGFYPNNFLHEVDASMDLLEPTVAAPPLRQIKQKMILSAVSGILKLEKSRLSRRHSYVRSKLSILVTATVNTTIKKSVVKYITEKIKTRLDLGLEWLHKEYAIFRGPQNYQASEENLGRNTITYSTLFCMLSTAILEAKEEDRRPLMTKLYVETPMVPDEAVECWKNIIPDERGLAVMELLRNVMMEMPGKLRKLLDVLLYYSNHEISIIRKGCVNLTMDFYRNPIFTKVIKDYALLHLEYLRLIVPPPELFGDDQGRAQVEFEWTDSTVRACLALYIGLVEKHPNFIKELEQLFPSIHSTVQKKVLKYIRTFDINTPLLDRSYIKTCYKLY